MNFKTKATIVLMSVALVSFCGEKKPAELTGVATFVKGQAFVNEAPLRVGSKVRGSDVVQVKKASGAIIQFSTGALITLKANTKLEVARLMMEENGRPVVELNQTSGSTFSKIVPGKASYMLKTPTAVAGVRGTAFSVSVDEKQKSHIMLLHGKVKVESRVEKGKKKEMEINDGQKITISNEKGIEKTKKLEKEEKESLKDLDTIAFVSEETINKAPEKIEAAIKEDKSMKVIEAKVEEAVVKESIVATKEAATEEVAVKKMTLDDLRTKYGKLTKIITHSGKTYVGGDWKQLGDYHYIRTVDGKEKIKTDEVQKVLPMD